MTAKLTACRGLPASGKTTHARWMLAEAQPGRLVRLNRDDLRASMHGQAHYQYATEQQVTMAQHGTAEAMLRAGVDVVVDDTNLKARHLRAFAELAWRCDAEFEVADYCDVPLEVCIARDIARGETVGEKVIRSMHERYLAGKTLPLPVPEKPEQVTGERYVPDPSLPSAVMVDIDGTVALHGARDPYDTSRYHEDTANDAVVSAVCAAAVSGYRIVFCSGREDAYRDVTEKWLADNVPVAYDGLFMRATGDKRRDDVIKLELFDQHIRGRFNVAWCYDDRDRVVAAWRSIGLPVFQVAEGAF